MIFTQLTKKLKIQIKKFNKILKKDQSCRISYSKLKSLKCNNNLKKVLKSTVKTFLKNKKKYKNSSFKEISKSKL